MSQLMRSGLEFAACVVSADNLFERFRVVQALGGVEDFDAGEKVGGVVVEGDAGGKLSELTGFLGFGGLAGLRPGCDWIPGFVVGAVLEDDLSGRHRVVHALGDVENFFPASCLSMEESHASSSDRSLSMLTQSICASLAIACSDPMSYRSATCKNTSASWGYPAHSISSAFCL